MNFIDQIYFTLLNYKNAGQTLKEFKKLKNSEFWKEDELKSLQLNKLKTLFERSSANVAYWKEHILPEHLDKLNKKELHFLDDFPILTKEIIRNQADRMWSGDVSNYIVATTGGTTGHPLTIRRDLMCDAITKAALWRARISWGIRPSVRTLYLKAFGTGTAKGKFKMRLANKRVGEAFPSSDRDVKMISDTIVSFRPKAIEGFATGLMETTSRITGVQNLKVPVIISTGEMLYPHQRQILSERYLAEVYTYYGSNEIGSIAYECENHNLHVCEEHVIVETVNEDGKAVLNEPGRIVVTDLDNTAMPFIRYELGDVGVITDKPCTCGRNSKVISELIGRSQDFLSSSSGRRLQATQLAAYLKDLKAVGQLRFIQRNEDDILIQFDGNRDEAETEIEIILSHLNARLGDQVKIMTENVTEIPKTSRGKQPLVVRQLQN